MSEEKLQDEDILALCKSLANRYRKPEAYDDLVSEGILACYESLAVGKDKKEHLVGAARRAMNDFINIKSKAMSIPKSWTSRAVSRALATDEDMENLEGVNEETLYLLIAAMRNDGSSVDESMSTTEGAEVDFEEREHHLYLLNKVREALDEDDWEFLLMVSDEDTTHLQVADILNISHQAVSLRLRKIQSKARRFVTKSDLSDL